MRERAARAVQAVFAELGFPAVTDEEVDAGGYGPRQPRPARPRPGGRRCRRRPGAGRENRRRRRGARPRPGRVHGRGRGDPRPPAPARRRRHPPDGSDRRAGLGGRVGGQRPERLPGPRERLPAGRRALEAPAGAAPRGRSRNAGAPGSLGGAEARRARRGERRQRSRTRSSIAIGPAFLDRLRETIGGLPHEAVLAAISDGVRAGGAHPRIVRVRRSADVAFIGHDGAVLSGSGIAVGLQSKGTAVIHRADLQPLDNLELFGMAPLLTLESYRAIGRNAAAYALAQPVGPGPRRARQLRAGQADREDDAPARGRDGGDRPGRPAARAGARARLRASARLTSTTRRNSSSVTSSAGLRRIVPAFAAQTPSRPSRSAVARPMPRLAPVTSAASPARNGRNVSIPPSTRRRSRSGPRPAREIADRAPAESPRAGWRRQHCAPTCDRPAPRTREPRPWMSW